jgi:hypothetical protein
VGGGNAPVQPDETFGGDVFLLLELVEDEVLQGFGKGGGGELAFADFLRRVSLFVRHVGVSCELTLILPTMSFFTGLNAAEPSTSTPVSLHPLVPYRSTYQIASSVPQPPRETRS